MEPKDGDFIKIHQMVYLFKELIPLKDKGYYDVIGYFAISKKTGNKFHDKEYKKTVPISENDFDRRIKRGAFQIVAANAENLARLCEGEARSNPVKKHCITGLLHFVRKDASAEFATI